MTDASDVARSRGSEGSAFVETSESNAPDTRGLRWNLTAEESQQLGRLIVASLRNFAELLDSSADSATTQPEKGNRSRDRDG
jgi:hypothetical protein